MILVVGAIIVDSLDSPSRVLAARRSAPSGHAGGWEFPGGKAELGEEARHALHRELAEELGVEVAIGVEFKTPVGEVWPIDERYGMRTWFAEIIGPAPTPTGSHDELRWLDPDHLLDVAWLPADRPIVELLRPRLESGGQVLSRAEGGQPQ